MTDYTPPEVLIECVPGGFFGEDIDGHPVWYDNFGNLDSRGMCINIMCSFEGSLGEILMAIQCWYETLTLGVCV